MAGEFAFMADWDLDAVVRGSCCNHISATPAAAADLQPSIFNFDFDSFHDNNSFPFASSSMDRLMLDDDYTDLDGLLEGLYQPFCNQQLSSLTTTAPPLVMAAPPTEPSLKLPPASPVAILDLSSASSSSASPSNNISAAKLRKRRNQQKRVVEQVREEGISSDKWAWRKYGQKPIKGSPYPRSYYRCSSLKGCPARKQVERSTSDPSIFIITYTSEHSHAHPTRRNSLAGSTRVRNLVSSKETVANYSEAATPIALVEGDKHSPPSTASIEEELMLVKEEDEGGVLFEDGILYQSSSDVDFVGCDDVSFRDALYPGVAGGLDGMFMNRW